MKGYDIMFYVNEENRPAKYIPPDERTELTSMSLGIVYALDNGTLAIASDSRLSKHAPCFPYLVPVNDDFQKITVVDSCNTAVLVTGDCFFGNLTFREAIAGFNGTADELIEISSSLLQRYQNPDTKITFAGFTESWSPYYNRVMSMVGGRCLIKHKSQCRFSSGEPWASALADAFMIQRTEYKYPSADDLYSAVDDVIRTGESLKEKLPAVTVGGHPDVWVCRYGEMWKHYDHSLVPPAI